MIIDWSRIPIWKLRPLIEALEMAGSSIGFSVSSEKLRYMCKYTKSMLEFLYTYMHGSLFPFAPRRERADGTELN